MSRGVWHIVSAGALALILAGCASHMSKPVPGTTGASSTNAPASNASTEPGSGSSRYRLQQDRGPAVPPKDIATLPEPVPTVEPRSPYGNKSPYVVNGRTYYVLDSARGYSKIGMASWYGEKFNGYLTSSHEPYDMYGFTAASKVLPIPTFVRVTNLANHESVIVKVNDRGPFVKGRIIDLSYAAAVRIGIWPKGTGRVEVTAIDPRTYREPSQPSVVTAIRTAGKMWLQLGAFVDAKRAARLAQRLRAANVGPVQLQPATVAGRHFTRVRVGPFADAAAVHQAMEKVRQMGLATAPIAVD